MANVWRLIACDQDAAGVVDLIRKIGQIWMGWGATGDLSRLPYQSAREISQAI